MPRKGLTIDMIREKMDELVGKDVQMRVCRGRKQIKYFQGVVENAFARVFVVRLTSGGEVMKSLSYSYSDVLCGEVVISELVSG